MEHNKQMQFAESGGVYAQLTSSAKPANKRSICPCDRRNKIYGRSACKRTDSSSYRICMKIMEK